MWQCLKIPQDCRQGKFELLKPPNILQPPNIWQYLKIQQDCQKRAKLFIYWSHQIYRNVWKYHRIGGHGGKLKFLKPPNILPYLKIQQDFQPRGNIWIIEDTKYVTMFENTTKLQATGKSLSCCSHPMISIFEGTTRLPETVKIQSIEATKKAMFNG